MDDLHTPASESKPVGRPSLFTPELATRICERLAAGETLRGICRDDDMPAHSTVLAWTKANKEFSDQYARARENGFALMADELIDIADGGSSDPVRDRLSVDTRKWLLSKALPKVYGDKLQHVGGGEGEAPIALSVIELVAVKPNAAAD